MDVFRPRSGSSPEADVGRTDEDAVRRDVPPALAALTTGEAIAEVRRLRRQLQRERARRVAAESLGEQATRDLYDSVNQLRTAQTELLERAELSRVITELARALRQDDGATRTADRAARLIAQATAADRCEVVLLDSRHGTADGGTWSDPELGRDDPIALNALPEPLRTELAEAGASLTPLRIEHVGEDARLDAETADRCRALLGGVALAAVPIPVGNQVAGWILLVGARPRMWAERDLAICTGLTHDLITTLAQARAFEQQRESMLRLQELDSAKDAFISNVSHELRTPLTSIVGYLELFADGGMGELSEDQAAGLGIVERNVSRLRALVEDLLTLSAYDAATGPRVGRPVDLAAIVVECLQSMRPTIARAGLEVELDIDPTLGDVNGDVMELERVANNLLTNAIKFTPVGGRITVRLAQQRQMAVFAVADTGIGIPADEQSKLFSRFFRSSLAVADEIQGTGLGLALVHGIVEAYGGTIGLHSVVGEGTRVTVRLPLSP